MNDFDFFTVSASSTSIRSLMKLPNVKRERIHTKVYHKTIGGRRYRAYLYMVNLAYFDVMEVGHYSARKMADEFVNKIVGTKSHNVILSVSFQPMD
jgi:hypothetical protein